MARDEPGLYVGTGDQPVHLLPHYANRHGLIAGATGTGKTVSLQVLAEAFSELGTPVFLADIKGDLSGLGTAGTPKSGILDRLRTLGLPEDDFKAFPVIFWDLFGQAGHPVRVTISDIGPLLLGRLLELNEIQTGVLTIAFALADDEGLALLDLKDLRAHLTYVEEQRKRISATYGSVATASIGAIQRRLLMLEQEGAESFFGEPALDLGDLMRTTADGRGFINILAADQLYLRPRLYGTFLVWLLSQLWELLPEVGDPDKPTLVLFFDEAHLLFDEAPKPLVDKIEQVVRLIRSKGVGVYFITQNPLDVPYTVLGQLGNRIQHALRAFTPRDRRAVKAAAETFRPNPKFDTVETITQLGVGEALVSFLNQDGAPSVVERTLIRPPKSRLGPIDQAERAALMRDSPVRGVYDQALDRDSAYERLKDREAHKPPPEERPMRDRGRAGKGTLDRIWSSALSYGTRYIGRRLARTVLRSLFK